MPQIQRSKTINEAINWILSKLITIQQLIEDLEEQEELNAPSKLTLNDLVIATGTPANTLRSYSIYKELSRRFKSLEYEKNKGQWHITHEDIQHDIENKDDLYLEE